MLLVVLLANLQAVRDVDGNVAVVGLEDGDWAFESGDLEGFGVAELGKGLLQAGMDLTEQAFAVALRVVDGERGGADHELGLVDLRYALEEGKCFAAGLIDVSALNGDEQLE